MTWKSLILAWAAIALTHGTADETLTADSKEPTSITLRGRVVEIHGELKKSYRLELSSQVEPVYGFKTTEGRIYTLIKTRQSEALFMDQRLHQRELIIKGRQFPGSQVVEATFIQSVHQGRMHELYYYCDICSIKALTPEICSCCREPVRLVEEPAKSKNKNTN